MRRPRLIAISPAPSKASPLIVSPDPLLTGMLTRVQAAPPSVLSHAPE